MTEHRKIVSFPHMGNYYVPIKYLANQTLNMDVLIPPPITKKTIELGMKHSPDFVCIPFKYNLGNFIESLDKGASVLVQAGGGCRFGYYGEIQEQILKDLGYEFEFLNVLDGEAFSLMNTYKMFRKLNPKLSLFTFIYSFLMTMKMVEYMDELEDYIRKNIGFEVVEGSFEKLQKKFLKELSTVTTLKKLKEVYLKYKKLFAELKIDKPDKPFRVGVVGELYVLMEPFSNYFIEKELAQYGIEVHRFITVTYLLNKKPEEDNKLAKRTSEYMKYPIGGDGTESVAKAKELAEEGFDGIIHVKPFGCTPEVNSMPMVQKISNDYKIPVLYFSFDSQTSETGIKTRLEAFYDMLMMKKERVK